jgi:hypothetical protein
LKKDRKARISANQRKRDRIEDPRRRNLLRWRWLLQGSLCNG